ncbi:MAG: Holliday junction branch migration protein RuvA [Gammaproteobacteria bacterium]|nr:Holliday junction branch migration protein RuvA [Gammaproteobacteria bacterium]
MIGHLRGQVVHKRPPQLVVDVSGVGYELEAPMSTFYDLPAVGEAVLLYTHLVVREDAHTLYGFAREAERGLFRALLRVNGVGPKVALALLSGMNAEEFARCVQREDVASLTRLPGVGKKTAERLVVEMRDRLERLDDQALVDAVRPRAAGAAPPSAVEDAVSALIALGYRPPEASRMVRAVAADGVGSEDLIRAALKAAAPQS